MEEDLFLFGWKKVYIKFSLWVSYEISYIFLKVFFFLFIGLIALRALEPSFFTILMLVVVFLMTDKFCVSF